MSERQREVEILDLELNQARHRSRPMDRCQREVPSARSVASACQQHATALGVSRRYPA